MKYKILIVDDDEAILKPYKEFFSEYGFFTETAADGKQGLEKLKTGEFDVAIVDIQMPVMNGIEMIRQTKEAGIDTDIIVLTGHGGEKEAVQALKLGAADWFYKHEVTMSLLKDKVDALTKGALENVRFILKDLPILEEWNFDGR